MRKLLMFILLGLLFAMPGEILNQLLARHDFKAFWITMISYAILLFIGFFAGKVISTIFTKPRARLIYYLFFGFLGLMVEWFLLGNAPVLEPLQIITQPGMFTYWGTLLLAPCLIMDCESGALKRPFVLFFASFSTAYLLVALTVPRNKGGIFFGFVIFAAGTTALNYFYVKYFKGLSRAEALSKNGVGQVTG